MRTLGFFLLPLLVSCSVVRSGLSVRLTGARALPVESQMDCYFVSVAGGAAPGTPACMGLGRVSALVSWSQITGGGVGLRVPLGFGRVMRVMGVGTGGACSGKQAVSGLFAGGARPDVYVLAEERVDILGQVAIELSSNYQPGVSPNLGACDGAPPVLTSVSPLKGGHRGGFDLSAFGSGFVSGATILVGGTPATKCELVSDTEVKCAAPSVVPSGPLAVTVANPGGTPGGGPDTFKPVTYVFVAQNNGGGYRINAYEQDPEDGELTFIDFYAVSYALDDLALHPSGKWLFASHAADKRITVWAVNAVNGSLSPAADESYAAVSAAPQRLAASPDGRFVVATDPPSIRVHSFAFTETGPDLSYVSQNASHDMTSFAPYDVGITRGNVVFVARAGANGPSRKFLGDDGKFTDDSSTGLGFSPYRMAIRPVADFLLLADMENNFYRSYSLDASAALTGTGSLGVGTIHVGPTFTPDGRFFYSGNNGDRLIDSYAFSDSGAISPVAGGSAGSGVTQLTDAGVDGSGRYYLLVSVGDASKALQAFAIDGTGKVVGPSLDQESQGLGSVSLAVY